MAYFIGLFLSLAFEVPVSNLETLLIDKFMGKIMTHRYRKPPRVEVEFGMVSNDDAGMALKEEAAKSCTDDV